MIESLSAIKLLVFARNEATGQGIADACRGADEVAPQCFVTTDLTRAVDISRDREPQAALIELTGDVETDRQSIRELRAVTPETVLVGVHAGEGDPGGVSLAMIVQLVREGVADFLRLPIPQRELRQLFDRLRPRGQSTRRQLGRCIAFMSNKGGVGKSTLAVNTAVSLASRYPNEVLLIDASLQMGVCAAMLNLEPKTTLLDAFQQRQRLDETLIRQLSIPHESGLLLLAAPMDPVAAADIDDQSMTRLLNLSRRTFRYVVVDTFPLFDQIVMTVLDIVSRAYVVLDNVVPTVLSAVQLLKLLDDLQYPHERIGIVVNRFQRITGNPSIEDIGRALRLPVDSVIPYSRRAIVAANSGRPFSSDFVRFSKLHRAMADLVASVDQVSLESPAVETSGADNE
ncbi:CpaE family protein [Rhodopirellula sp. MGV]|uniref:AAA family ATPase n=1 Tax=Rhodopirellula sp. MGV TaxID=2023130 RepID=UPI0013044DA0|nr:AAA family ATPase [Rhodopirellula sp. MGV]